MLYVRTCFSPASRKRWTLSFIHTPYTTRAFGVGLTERLLAVSSGGVCFTGGSTHPADEGVVEKHCRKLPSWVYRIRVSCGLGCANKTTEVNFLARKKDGSVLATAPPKTYYVVAKSRCPSTRDVRDVRMCAFNLFFYEYSSWRGCHGAPLLDQLGEACCPLIYCFYERILCCVCVPFDAFVGSPLPVLCFAGFFFFCTSLISELPCTSVTR